MKTSGGKILLMECKNALKHRSTAHMIANKSAMSNFVSGRRRSAFVRYSRDSVSIYIYIYIYI